MVNELNQVDSLQDKDKLNSDELGIISASSKVVLAAASAILSSCGGGGGGESSSSSSSSGSSSSGSSSATPTGSTPGATSPVTPAPSTPSAPPTQSQAAGFLMQASLGIPLNGLASSQSLSPASLSGFMRMQTAQASLSATSNEVSRIQERGYSAWLDEQFAMPVSKTIIERLQAKGYAATNYKDTTAGFDSAIWRHLITAPDTLRQRIALALSEILVVGIDGLVEGRWASFSAAAYYELLCDHSFGNYRDLLQAVSKSPAMGCYLTFKGNRKRDPVKGSMPDENYARELLQLFTIGLIELNIDGTPKLLNGSKQETYTQDDITQLARIFTGWDFDLDSVNGVENNNTPAYVRRPMKQIPSRHETGASTFLKSTVNAHLDTQGELALTQALDIIYAHPNVAPFISKQLIQRLVTSNPTPAYVARVANVFNNDGAGVKGNMKAVIKTILLDSEARNDANLNNPQFGKVREPMLCFLAWARAFDVKSPSDQWYTGLNISDPNNRLGQSPLRSSSVFNFFRPGYVPPNSDLAVASLVAPELQIANEISIVSYVNFMQRVVFVDPTLGTGEIDGFSGVWDLTPDYSQLMTIADDAVALMKAINFVMTGNQLKDSTLTTISNAVSTISSATDDGKKNRIYAALTMVMACPEFIVQK